MTLQVWFGIHAIAPLVYVHVNLLVEQTHISEGRATPKCKFFFRMIYNTYK